MDKFEYQKKIPEFLPGSSKNFYVVERSFIKGFGSATAVTSVDPPPRLGSDSKKIFLHCFEF